MRELLERARNNILDLRRENEILRAKVETMELFRLALSARGGTNSRGFEDDIAWKIDQEIEEMDRVAEVVKRHESASLHAKEAT